MKHRNCGVCGAVSLLCLAAAILVSGCGTPEVRPANSQVFSQISSIAVLPFQGKDGEAFAREVESLLASLQGKQGVAFRVVTRSDIPTLEKEIKYQQSGLTERAALQLGKVMHVTSVMTGQVETTTDVSNFTRNVEVCVKPKGLLGCSQRQSQQARCSRTTVRFRAVPKLLNVESGQVLYSSIADGVGIQEKCSLDTYAVVADPLKVARDQALTKISRDVAPHTVTPTVFDSLLRSPQ